MKAKVPEIARDPEWIRSQLNASHRQSNKTHPRASRVAEATSGWMSLAQGSVGKKPKALD